MYKLWFSFSLLCFYFRIFFLTPPSVGILILLYWAFFTQWVSLIGGCTQVLFLGRPRRSPLISTVHSAKQSSITALWLSVMLFCPLWSGLKTYNYCCQTSLTFARNLPCLTRMSPSLPALFSLSRPFQRSFLWSRNLDALIQAVLSIDVIWGRRPNLDFIFWLCS